MTQGYVISSFLTAIYSPILSIVVSKSHFWWAKALKTSRLKFKTRENIFRKKSPENINILENQQWSHFVGTESEPSDACMNHEWVKKSILVNNIVNFDRNNFDYVGGEKDNATIRNSKRSIILDTSILKLLV